MRNNFIQYPVLFCILLSGGHQAFGADSRPLAGKVVSVSGNVLIRGDGGDGKVATASRALKPGESVREGDVINTPSDGAAKLLLEDKTIVDIGPSALFNVKKYSQNQGADRQVEIDMMYGNLRAAVTKKLQGKGTFKVRTPSATMGVRGTEFVVKAPLSAVGSSEGNAPGAQSRSVASSAPKTEVVVVQGKVDVAQTAPAASGSRGPAQSAPVVSLTAGQAITASSSEVMASKPVTLSTEQLQQVSSAAKVEDNTFKNAVSVNLSQPQNEGVMSQATSVIRETITAAARPDTGGGISAGPTGFIGTFSPASGLGAAPVNLLPGGLKRVRVVIKR